MRIVARDLSGTPVEVIIDGPSFREVRELRGETSKDLPWIAPGLIDIQINGFGGIDFNRVLESDDAWQHATQQLYAHGCTGFLIALITNRPEGYRELLGDLTARLRREPRNCLGFHMEGPWLNPDPGTRGAHRPEWMGPSDLGLLEEWHALADNWLQLITLAPEVDLEASLPVIRAATARDIRIFLGHSSAMGGDLQAAIDAGAVGWTHLGNAMPATVPKFENVILHVLSQPNLMASLIPDGVHLPPHAFRSLARALNADARLLLTTDAMAGAAAFPGAYSLGEVAVEVGADGTARLPGSGRLAGSTLTPLRGVLNAARMADLSLAEAWSAFSTGPAQILGLSRSLSPGAIADFCLLSPDEEPKLLETWHRGACVHKAK